MKRNYGIDLLRLVLMFMVCMLHTLGQGGVLSACQRGTVAYAVYWLLETFAYCAVNGFALISGYTATDRPQRYARIVEMWLQVFFYSFVVTVILWTLGMGGGFSLKTVIKAAMPVTFGAFWYFTAYFALFFAMPLLNRFLFDVDEVTAKKALIILAVLYSGLGSLYDPFYTQSGYSALWLMVLYCMGVLAKRVRLFEKRKTFELIVLWAVCIGVSWAFRIFANISLLISYVSPTIVLNAMIMVVLFSRLQMRGTGIRKVAPLAFGIYLFQLNGIVWQDVLKEAVTFVADEPLGKGVLIVFAASALIFVSGLLVEFIRTKLFSALHLSLLSEKIAVLTDRLLEKLFIFMK